MSSCIALWDIKKGQHDDNQDTEAISSVHAQAYSGIRALLEYVAKVNGEACTSKFRVYIIAT